MHEHNYKTPNEMHDIKITVTYGLLKEGFRDPNHVYTVKTILCLTCLYPFTGTFHSKGFKRKKVKQLNSCQIRIKRGVERKKKIPFNFKKEEENTLQFQKGKCNQLDSYKGATDLFKIISQICK